MPNKSNEHIKESNEQKTQIDAYKIVEKAHSGFTKGENKKQLDKSFFAIGGNSLISPDFPKGIDTRSYSLTALVTNNGSGNDFADPMTFYDKEGQPQWYQVFDLDDIDVRKPTTTNILKWSKRNDNKTSGNKRPYKYTDFVFTKHFDIIPNNRLITLRRYPYPVTDNLEFVGESDKQQYYSPLAQALTYFGEETGNELSELMSFNVELPYKTLKSKVNEINETPPGSKNSPFGKFSEMISIITGEANFDTISKDGQYIDPYNNGVYSNRIYGDINRIDEIKQREAGLNFKQEFELKFHYVARPIANINTKVIMLELISNLLVLCYAEGSFWGGANRFIVGKPQYPFAGGEKGMKQLYSGNIAGFMDSFTEQIVNAKNIVGDFIANLFSDPISSLKKLASGGMEIGLAKYLAKKRMVLLQAPALLLGLPVGEWHLTIGNPFNPILEIGNLVCTGLSFEFSNELGADDFPTEMTAKVKLEHGMGRDSSAIQSMFNRGGGKIYYLPDKYQFGYESNKTNPNAGNTQVDKYTKTAGGIGGGKSGGRKNRNHFDRVIDATGKDFKKIASGFIQPKVAHGYTVNGK